MNKRLEEARIYLGLSKTQLADGLGLKIHNIRDMETGKQKIGAEIATIMEEKFSINGWWLLTGKGKMLENESKSTNNVSNNLVELMYYEDILASAGGGAYNQSEATTLMAFDKTFLKQQFGLTSFNNIHIITSTGDSMEPTISAGELLFISPIENEANYIKEGGIYIIMCGDSVLLKRVSKNNISKEITLISDNRIYPSQTIKIEDFESCKILGRVIGHFNGL